MEVTTTNVKKVIIFKRDDSTRSFDDVVDEIAKRDDCSRTHAMTTARIEHPGAFAAYQNAEIAIEKKKAPRERDEVDDIELRAQAIREETGCSGCAALSQARREHQQKRR